MPAQKGTWFGREKKRLENHRVFGPLLLLVFCLGVIGGRPACAALRRVLPRFILPLGGQKSAALCAGELDFGGSGGMRPMPGKTRS